MRLVYFLNMHWKRFEIWNLHSPFWERTFRLKLLSVFQIIDKCKHLKKVIVLIHSPSYFFFASLNVIEMSVYYIFSWCDYTWYPFLENPFHWQVVDTCQFSNKEPWWIRTQCDNRSKEMNLDIEIDYSYFVRRKPK